MDNGTIRWLVLGFELIILCYFFVLNSSYLVTTFFAFKTLRKYARRLKILDLDELMATAGPLPITLVVPAYNEEATCVESLTALLSLEYPEYEVLVVNDGSTDNTFGIIEEHFDLKQTFRVPTADIPTEDIHGAYRSEKFPNLWLVNKANGGKADALNAGLKYCRTPLFCAMDADTLLERDALTRIVRPFLENSSTIATGGIIRIVNGCKVESGLVRRIGLPSGWLPRFQVIEYLRAFLAGRVGWDALDILFIISGAFGLFRRDIVVEAGGFSSRKTGGHTVGEDMELVVRLHRYCRDNNRPYQITYIPDPVAWTVCPESFSGLSQQRDRWHRGLFETLRQHKKMFFNPRYGRIGLVGYPYYFFLELIGPVIEVMGYFYFAITLLLGVYSPLFAITFTLVAFVFGMAISVAAVALEELTFRRYPSIKDLFKLFWYAIVENFGYRQITTFWRFRGVLSALRKKQGWGEMETKEFREHYA